MLAVRNRELATLAQEVYYDVNGSELGIDVDGGVEHPNSHIAHMVRRLWLRLDDCTVLDTINDTLFRDNDPWRYLLRYREGYQDDRRLDEEPDEFENIEKANRGPVGSSDVEWQTRFNNLRRPDIVFQLASCGSDGDGALARLKTYLARTEMILKAHHVT